MTDCSSPGRERGGDDSSGETDSVRLATVQREVPDKGRGTEEREQLYISIFRRAGERYTYHARKLEMVMSQVLWGPKRSITPGLTTALTGPVDDTGMHCRKR